MSENILIKVRDLEVNFYNNERCNKVLRGVSFNLEKGKIMCIVGESGCGKSVTANAIMGLLPDLSRIEKGEIHFYDEGKDIRIDKLKRKGKEMREIRGNGISMIFQDPMTALNPVFTVGYQINESLLYHKMAKNKTEAKEQSIRLLKDMGIPLPEKRVDEYPYQFSGGMCQRAMIAMAMSCQPKVLIADEPTTALDVTIQAQIFELMLKLKNEKDAAILLITHDMGVVAELADNVAVMYMGNIVESGDAEAVLTHSAHPYTKALIQSIPVLGRGKKQDLQPIKGSTPDPYNRPKGCQFAPRCEFATEQCKEEMPPEMQLEPGHYCRCFHSLTGKVG
ncbi:ABC transporter ATP-binding protein [Oribacterium sinus]|jgi:oligopeptide/dipeptide ABC transporter, ATP-binding protein, C-terminal domain|uniref:ABC transporter ATP-binding protein n=1 Tax=Oribacterium sinus TaxID=237576 RepID=UPI0028E95726|nr:ABC transporter ATP-binding protein [Oribacterium sinus]